MSNRSKLPSQKMIDILATRAETAGCDRCSAAITDLIPYFICRTSKDWTVRCSACREIGAKPLMLGLYRGGESDPWIADDRSWFAANPARTWRLRDLCHREINSFSGADPKIVADARQKGWRIAVAVFQHAEGKRFRSLVAVPFEDPLDSFTQAGIAVMAPDLAKLSQNTAGLTDADWAQMQRNQSESRLRAALSIAGRRQA